MRYLLFLSSLVILSACTTLKVEPEKLKEVKKVAIIGFDVLQQRPMQGTDLLKIATHVKLDNSAQTVGRQEAKHVAELYDNFALMLQKQKKITVVNQKDLIKNPAYIAYFKDKTEGWQNRPMINDRFDLYASPGVLDSFAVQTTKEEVLKKLQMDLGVDAIMTVSSTVNLNMDSVWASLVGQAEFSPSASTHSRMVDMRTVQELWIDGHAEGQEIKAGEKNFLGLADESKMNKLCSEATKSSYDVLFTHLNEKLGDKKIE